jgi:DNA polymerase
LLHLDIETRSRLDLKKVGAWVYAADPSTDILCMPYAVDDGPVQIWHRDDPVPPAFIAAERDPDWRAIAHNAAFDRVIALHVLGPRYGFPEIPIERWRCTMAQALACALPGKLEKVADVLGLPYRKDPEGARLIRLLCKPRPDGSFNEDPVLLQRFGEYSVRDVETERALHHRLPELSDAEQAVWRRGQRPRLLYRRRPAPGRSAQRRRA